MKTIYLKYRGDLWEVTFDRSGYFHKATVYRDNCSRIGEPVEFWDLPDEVYENAINKMLKNGPSL